MAVVLVRQPDAKKSRSVQQQNLQSDTDLQALDSSSSNSYAVRRSTHVPRVLTGPVAVFSSHASDAEFVSDLLIRAGIDLSKIVIGNDADATNEEPQVTVLVHRRVDDQGDETGASQVLGEALESNSSQRAIVFTDCNLEDTVVHFLEQGARHCLDLNEPVKILQARLEAALRVHPGTAQQSFSVGDIHFNIQRRKATRAGELIDLSPKEFDFARYLFSNPDKIIGNAELMTSVWSLPTTMDSRRIDTAACRVRKKLRLSGDDGWNLKRIRRVGYHLQSV